jgi:endonuclease/exonuclease/phosphatase family metal-dependent hydrolase
MISSAAVMPGNLVSSARRRPSRRTRTWCVAVCSIVASLTVADAAIVRVLDYNIHRDLGGNDANVSAQPALAKVVNYLRPDIWTMNEVGGNSAGFSAATARAEIIDFVQSDLTIFGANPIEGIDYFVYVAGLNDGFSTNAIVSRYPFLSTQTYSDAGSGFAALRGLVSAFVDLPGEIDAGVFSAHLKALSSTTDAERRQAEANTNAANVATWLSAHAGAAAVVTGDWNETEEAGENSNWSGHRIGDPLPNTGEPYHPVSTMRLPELRDPLPTSIRGDRDTISATNPNARFDYLFYTPEYFALESALVFDTKQYSSNELAALNAANGTSFVAGDSALASDHLPVLVVLDLVPEPGVGPMILWVIVAKVALLPRRFLRPRC